jgi:hypothetical protein
MAAGTTLLPLRLTFNRDHSLHSARRGVPRASSLAVVDLATNTRFAVSGFSGLYPMFQTL